MSTNTASLPVTRPLTAFISGPIDVSTAYFKKYYQPQIDSAIASSHSFVIGPVSGIDALALTYLLSSEILRSRIRIFMAGFETAFRPAFVRELEKDGIEVVEVSEALTTWDRDAAMTRASDYDILRFRTEWEAKAMYGERWRARVSNTERNWRRRRGENAEEVGIEYITHIGEKEETVRRAFPWITAREESENDVCDGTCDAHRHVVYLPLILGRLAFGVGNDGDRRI